MAPTAMIGAIPSRDSLVLYKGRPAKVRQAGKRLEIEVEGGTALQVRPKDVQLLHPGPIRGLAELQPHAGEVETTWELLLGSVSNLAELAELVYGAFTPATAWAAWQLVADGLYFHGTPEAVLARSPEEVRSEKAVRAARAADEEARAAFLRRARARHVLPEDGQYLREVEDLALARRERSPLLRALGHSESPESAHALLLGLEVWDRWVNPYPRRLRVATTPPALELPELPEEARLDLTHLHALAIDDEGNLDPDDAICLEGSRLWVHVADVAALVGPDSPADLEARARGASLYLPEGTVPMLPAEATQRLGLGLAAALTPPSCHSKEKVEGVSPALSFGLDLDGEARLLGVEIVPSWVRVARLTYEEAEAILDSEPLASLWRLLLKHRQRRLEQRAIQIDLPEVKIRLEDGAADGAAPRKIIFHPILPLRSRDLVTEAMLMAGEAIAMMAIENSLPMPFAVQPPLDEATAASDLAGMFALRRTVKPSQHSTIPAPHGGLGLEAYVQATSPLRRYLDLVVHQQLRAHLRGEEPLGSQELVERIGAAEAAVGSISQAERVSRRHWTLVYFLEEPAWRGEGVLVEQRGRRGTLLIPDFALETTVHLRTDLPLNSRVELAQPTVNLTDLTVHFQVADSPGRISTQRALTGG